jgi:hypothetical protein
VKVRVPKLGVSWITALTVVCGYLSGLGIISIMNERRYAGSLVDILSILVGIGLYKRMEQIFKKK